MNTNIFNFRTEYQYFNYNFKIYEKFEAKGEVTSDDHFPLLSDILSKESCWILIDKGK